MSCRALDAAVYAAFLALAILAAHYEFSLHARSSAAASAAARASALLAESHDINATAAALANASASDALAGSGWISRAEGLRVEGELDEETAANASALAGWLREHAEKERSEAARHEATAEEDERIYEEGTKNATIEAELEKQVEDEMRRHGCDGRFVIFRRRRECDELRQKAEFEKEAALAELRAAGEEREDEARERAKAADLKAQAEADMAEAGKDEAGAAEERDRAAREEEEAAKDEATAEALFNRSRTEGDRASEKEREAAREAQAALKLLRSAATHRHMAARNRRIAISLAALVLTAFFIRLIVLAVNPLRSAFDYVSAIAGFVRKNKPSSSATLRFWLIIRTMCCASWKNITFVVVHCLALLLALASLSDQWVALGAENGPSASLLSRGSMTVLTSVCLAVAAKTAAVATLAHVIGLDPLPRLCNAYRVQDDATFDSRTDRTRQKVELRIAAEFLFIDSAFLFMLFAMETLILWVVFGTALFDSHPLSTPIAPWIYGFIFVTLAALRLHHLGLGRREMIPSHEPGDEDGNEGTSFWPSESELLLGMVDEVLEGADFDRNVATGQLLRVFEEIDSTSNDQQASETDSLLGRVVGKGGPERRAYDANEDNETEDGVLDVVGLSSGRVSVISSIEGERGGRERRGNEQAQSSLWRTLAVRRVDMLECPFTILVIVCMASAISLCSRS